MIPFLLFCAVAQGSPVSKPIRLTDPEMVAFKRLSHGTDEALEAFEDETCVSRGYARGPS